MAYTKQQLRTLNRLRDLQPVPDWGLAVLGVVAQPLLWLIIAIVMAWRSGSFSPINQIAIFMIIAPVSVMFLMAQRLRADIRPDAKNPPEDVESDPELQRVWTRLTREGRVVRAAQRAVIDAYIAAHHPSDVAQRGSTPSA